MKFTNTGKKFYFDKGNPDEGWVIIRVASPQILEQIELDNPIEQDKNERLWDYVIVDWENVEDDDGKVECTRENKVNLMRTSPVFLAFVNKFLNSLNAEYKEILEKN